MGINEEIDFVMDLKKYYTYFNQWRILSREVNCTYRAAALTYMTLLALVPLMVVSFDVLAIFPVSKTLAVSIEHFIFQNFVPATGQVVQDYLESFAAQAKQLSFIGAIFLIVTAILLLFTVEQSFNAIWQIKKHRHGVMAFFVYGFALIIIPILIGIGFAITSYISALPLMAQFLTHIEIENAVFYGLPYLFSSIALVFLYKVMPNCKVRLSAALWAGFLAALLFEVAKIGFTLFVQHFPAYQLLYGALAAIPLFLIWVYLSWLIILWGGVFSKVLVL